jgi:type III pantothenate kinase
MNLLLDLGNTRLKWAWHDGDALRAPGVVAHGEAGWADTFAAALRAGPAPARAWLAAVGAESLAATAGAALRAVHPECVLERVHSPADGAGVVNAYAEPARLGVDRFLALVGARGRTPGAALVAGCGTALAVDAIDAEGRHLGGVIAPGARRMREAVLATTARVRPHGAGPPVVFGRSTEEGLDAGCALAVAALVDRLVDEATARLGEAPVLLLHGGDAGPLAERLRHRASLAPDLVLEGLARWAALHA